MFTTKHLSLRLMNPRLLFESGREAAILRFDAAPDNNSIALPDKRILYTDNDDQNDVPLWVSVTDCPFEKAEAGLFLWVSDSIDIILSANPKQFAQLIDCTASGAFPRGLSIAIKEGLTVPGQFEISKDEYEITSWSFSIKPN